MSDVVEAMADRIAYEAEHMGIQMPGRVARCLARAAIRAVTEAGGLVVGKMPAEQPEPDEARDWLDKSYAAQQWRRALARGRNDALAAVRAAAVEVE